MTDEFTDWDAGYVLGALPPDDRRRYEEHVAGCVSCAAAVRDLAGIPGILGELGRAEAESLRDPSPVPTPALGGGVQPAARRVLRRRRRVRLLVAASVIVLLAGGSGAGWVLGRAAAPPATVTLASARTLEPVGPSHLFARLRITPVGWGTRLDWECDYRGEPGPVPSDAPPAEAYSLVVLTSDGRVTTVATWTSEGGEAKRLVAATAIPADSISSVEIRRSGSSIALARAAF